MSTVNFEVRHDHGPETVTVRLEGVGSVTMAPRVAVALAYRLIDAAMGALTPGPAHSNERLAREDAHNPGTEGGST